MPETALTYLQGGQFSEELTRRGKPEEEIWVTMFTNLIVSAMKKIEPQQVMKGEMK